MKESSDRGVYLASESRRVFLRDAAAALLVSHPVLGAVTGRREVTVAQPSPFKSEAQYKLEAARYDAAVRNLNAVLATRPTSDADLQRLTSILGSAVADVDYLDSSLVMLCYADTALMAWVRKEIRDEATLLRFVESVKRDPRVIDSISGVASLRGRWLERVRALNEQAKTLSAHLVELVEASQDLATQSRGKDEPQHTQCSQNWSIVTAVFQSLFANAGAAAFTSLTVNSLSSAATSLTVAYKGTGADLARTALLAANQRYQQCVASTTLLSEPARSRAMLVCQAKWLAEKASYLG